jgi:hypothetical protein
LLVNAAFDGERILDVVREIVLGAFNGHCVAHVVYKQDGAERLEDDVGTGVGLYVALEVSQPLSWSSDEADPGILNVEKRSIEGGVLRKPGNELQKVAVFRRLEEAL